MIQDFAIHILLCSEEDLPVPGKLYNFRFYITHSRTLEELEKQLTVPPLPDYIVTADGFAGLRGGDLVLEIKKHSNAIPLIILLDNSELDFVREFFEAGADDVIQKKDMKKELLILASRMYNQQDEKDANDFLIKNFAALTARLQEKNTIFETMVDLLSHDTRNLFFYIHTLISQVDDTTLKVMIENALQELNNTIVEATGYLNSRKRIESALVLTKSIKLTKDRVSILTHNRITITHDPEYLLFVETSSLFKNALVNILENALKYTPGEKPVNLEIKREEECIRFIIRDQGPGIADNHKEKIFDRFVRLERDEPLEGSGRGLWITRNIIEKEAGTIVVEDNDGGGSAFIVTLPPFRVKNIARGLNDLSEWFHVTPELLRQKEQTIQTFLQLQQNELYNQLEDKESVIYANLLQLMRDEVKTKTQKHFYKKLMDLKSLNPGGKSVLIVDDSIYVHYYLGTHFAELGYRVVGFANTGRAGVSYHKTLKPDLVTLDYTMPEMSGLEAAVEILKNNPETRLLFITGVGDHPSFISSLKENLPDSSYRILKKPFKKEHLALLLENY